MILHVIALRRSYKKFCDDPDIDTAIYLQIDPPIAGPRAKFDRITSSGALAAHPRSKGSDCVGCLEERHKRSRVRADCHHGIKGSASQDRQAKS